MWAADAAAIAAYAALTVAMTWPLVGHLGAVVPKDLGDPLFSTWAMWWNARVLPFSDAWWQGPIYFPTTDTLALADHRVGLGLISTPLIWAGASPLAAYGIAFLASFVLSAAAAYALCHALTASRPAAFVGGLIFGFHPYRAAHLEHVELLSAYWLPLTLLCLHRWLGTGSRRALAAMSATLVLQALTSGYYYIYSSVLVAGWVAWFAVRQMSWRRLAELAAALAAPLLVLAPVLWRYRQAHQALGLSRTITEIEQLSADVAGLVTPPVALAFWNTSRPASHAEAALFPGLTAVAVIVLGLLMVQPTPGGQADTWRRVRRVCAGLAMVLAAVGVLATFIGPFAIGSGPLRVSVGDLYKPLSLAAVFALIALAGSPRLRDAARQRSPFAFYVLATLAMWLLALGPTARLFGERVLYKAPYAWLMLLPGFGEALRAPARFAMLAALTLAVAAALALARLTSSFGPSTRLLAWLAVVAGVTADGWIDRLPLPSPPPQIAAMNALPAAAVVLELPLGTFEDIAAMYRSMSHGHRLANGYSGYEPAHYTVLRAAIAEGRAGVVTALAATAGLAVVTAATPEGAALADTIAGQVPEAARSQVGDGGVLLIPARAAPDPLPVAGPALPIGRVTASIGGLDLGRLGDRDTTTAWTTPGSQTGGEQLVVELEAMHEVAGVRLGLGKFAIGYPRVLAVDLSTDGSTWSRAWHGDTAAPTMQAALADPAAVPVTVAFAPAAARFVRLTQEGAAPHPWAVAELAVLGPPGR